MIIEQIRYYRDDGDVWPLVEARRQVVRARTELGLPCGHILHSDAAADGSPCMVWECGYQDECEMAIADMRLLGNPGYEAARVQLASLATRIEVELYLIDGNDE